MSSSAITTLVTIMESLPENLQDRVVEYLREYIEDLRDEEQWNLSFQKTQQSLIMAAQRAKQEISEGKAQPLDIGQL
jgi:translation initiation factor 2B subunit (eIF-2B alpha/beta/delta family)